MAKITAKKIIKNAIQEIGVKEKPANSNKVKYLVLQKRGQRRLLPVVLCFYMLVILYVRGIQSVL